MPNYLPLLNNFEKYLQHQLADWKNFGKRIEIFVRTDINADPHIGNTNFGFVKEMFK